MKVINDLALKVLPISLTALTTVAIAPSQAAIIGSSVSQYRGPGGDICNPTGNPCSSNPQEITLLDSPTVIQNDNIRDNNGQLITTQNILGFDEKQDITLEQDILIWDDFQGPTPFDPSYRSYAPTISISAGTRVSSHLIFLEPTPAGAAWRGTVTFDQNIIGIIPYANGDSGLINSSSIFGLDTTQYDFRGRQLDYVSNNQDVATFEGNTLTFDLYTIVGMDPIRVITTVPEPFTMLGVGTAIGLGAFFKKKSSKK